MTNGTVINRLVFMSNTTKVTFNRGWYFADNASIPTPQWISDNGRNGLLRVSVEIQNGGYALWAIANRSVVTDAIDGAVTVNGKSFKFTDFDKYSLANVSSGSPKMWCVW